jgi:hypothetical protein
MAISTTSERSLNRKLRDPAEAGDPIRVRTRMEVGGALDSVFAAVARDVAGWGRWFPGFGADGHWATAEEPGLDSTRVITVLGRRFEERIVVWEENRRWSFVVDCTDAPLLRSLVEEYTFTDDGRGGTTVEWSGQIDAGRLNMVLGPLMRVVLPASFRHVARRLTRDLSR